MTIIQVGGIPADNSIIRAHPPTSTVGIDDPMLREMVSDTPVGGTAMLANGDDTPYAISGALEILKNMRLHGSGVVGQYDRVQPVGILQPIDQPVAAPWLRGSVIMQTLAGAHGVSFPQGGMTPMLKGFGVRFDDAIKFVNTGHGFNLVPTTAHLTGLDNGAVHPLLEDLWIYGPDGNHYGLKMTNQIYGRVQWLRSFGGGILGIEGNSAAGQYNYGNTSFENIFGYLFVGGTAHGYAIKQNRANAMGLLKFWNIQCNAGLTSKYPQAAVLTVAGGQHLFKADEGGFDAHIHVSGGKDFESALGLPVVFGNHLRSYVEPGGYNGHADGKHRIASDLGGRHLDSDFELPGEGNLRLPTIAAGAGAGTGATAAIANGSSDFRGGISITTGSSGISVASGQVAAVITHFTSGSVKNLKIIPRNLAAAAAGLLVNVSGLGATSSLRFTGGTDPAPGTLLTYAYSGDPV